jgi:hypothetical protein
MDGCEASDDVALRSEALEMFRAINYEHLKRENERIAEGIRRGGRVVRPGRPRRGLSGGPTKGMSRTGLLTVTVSKP